MELERNLQGKRNEEKFHIPRTGLPSGQSFIQQEGGNR